MKHRMITPGAGLATALLLCVRPSAAQDVTWASTLEHGGDDLTLVYSSVSLAPDWTGARPTVSLGGYYLDTEFEDTWSFSPKIGIEFRGDGGSVEASAGYSWKTSDEDDDLFGPQQEFFGGAEDGTTTGLHAEYWGDGSLGLQGIASYNWGSEYLWSRARATFRVTDPDPGSIHLGGEYVWQGETDDEAGEEYTVNQFGPVVQWHSGRNWILGAGGGWKNISIQDDTWYGKLEFVYFPD